MVNHSILTLSGLTTILLGSFLGACGAASFDTSQKLNLEIQGVHRAPPAGTGDSSPKTMQLTFASLNLTDSDGQVVDLSPEEPLVVNVINRPEVFLEADLKEYDGKTFSSVALGFSSVAEVSGRYKIRPMDLTTSTFTESTGFTVSDAKSFTLRIEIEWLNTAFTDETLLDEVFVEPGFELKLTNH
jgi:hypothetical protein